MIARPAGIVLTALLIGAALTCAPPPRPEPAGRRSLSNELKVRPLDYEKLKTVLPKSLKGMKRVDLFGEQVSALGVRVSYARAEYRGKEGARIRIKVTDTGNIKKVASLAMSAWISADIQRRSDDGYARTFYYKGHRAYVEYSSSKESGKVNVLVADRFLVEVDGKGTDMKAVEFALGKVNVKKLTRWRDVGAVR